MMFPRIALSVATLWGLLMWSSPGSAAIFAGLGGLPGSFFDSHVLAMSATGGVVVGDSKSSSGFEAMRWTAGGGMVGLGELPGGSFDTLANSWNL